MPTQTLRPSTFGGATGDGYLVPVAIWWEFDGVNGGDPTWTDDNDTTFSVASGGQVSGDDHVDFVWFQVGVIDFDPATCTDITVRARVKVDAVAGSDAEAVLLLGDQAGGTQVLAAWSESTTPAFTAGTIHDLVFDYRTEYLGPVYGGDEVGFLAALRGVAALFTAPRDVVNTPVVWTLADGESSSVFVYEVAIDLEYEDALVTPVTRQWPRDDDLGLGSASRIHPPPRSGRVVGGHQ